MVQVPLASCSGTMSSSSSARGLLPKATRELHKPLLIFHSPEDEIVPVEHGERLFADANQPKSMIAINGSDHLLLNDTTSAKWVATMISGWFSRFS